MSEVQMQSYPSCSETNDTGSVAESTRRSISRPSKTQQVAFLDCETCGEQQLSLDHVLGDVYAYPANLQGFLEFCDKQHCAENLEFLLAVREFRKLHTWEDIQHDVCVIIDQFIRSDSPHEINLKSKTRNHALQTATASITNKDGLSPAQDLDAKRRALASFDTAWKEIHRMLETDVIPRFKAEVVLAGHVQLAHDMALWCFNNKSQGWEFFTFPNPVNTVDTRLHASCALSLTLIILALNFLVFGFGYEIPQYRAISICLLSFMVYGYFARSLCGPRLDPQAYFILFVLNPLLVNKLGLVPQGDWAPSLPRRFAQMIGLAVTLPSLIFYIFGFMWITITLLCAFAGVMTVVVVFDFCTGCFIFYTLAGMGILEGTCSGCDVKYLWTVKARHKGLEVNVMHEGMQTVEVTETGTN